MKPNSLVVFDCEQAELYPFEKGELLLFLGEILDMPGHVIVVNRGGKVFWGYHAENFRVPTDEEK